MIADELNELGEKSYRQGTKKLQQSMATAIPGQALRVRTHLKGPTHQIPPSPGNQANKALLGDDGGYNPGW